MWILFFTCWRLLWKIINQVIQSFLTAVSFITFILIHWICFISLLYWIHKNKVCEAKDVTSEFAVKRKQNRTNLLTVSGAPVNVGTFVVKLDLSTLCCTCWPQTAQSRNPPVSKAKPHCLSTFSMFLWNHLTLFFTFLVLIVYISKTQNSSIVLFRNVLLVKPLAVV